MKKFISIILSITILLSTNIAIAGEIYVPDADYVSEAEAQQFADELKEMSGESYDSSLRLIVSANKQIDYLDAVNVATGIDNLYILQFDNENSVKTAENYYKTLSYVNYVEYDFVEENSVCGIEGGYNFTAQCCSTVDTNIDDAIKLIDKVKENDLPEIKVAIIDSGIASNSATKDRLDGGYSYLDGYSEDGTDDRKGHGSQVAGTIILNTLDNVRLYSYQILDANGDGLLSNAVSAIYLSITDGCKIINCSFGFVNSAFYSSMVEAVEFATNNGVTIIAASGNDSLELNTSQEYPARCEDAIAVGAVNHNKVLASFSNFGKGVDIYATGSNLRTYTNGGGITDGWSGTSAATPVVSSICALLLQVNPNLTANEIETLLRETGTSTNEDYQTDECRLIADAYACVKALTGAELKQLELTYTVTPNETSGCSDVTFTCNDKNATIYYTENLGANLYIPFEESTAIGSHLYENGSTINTSKFRVFIATAYAPGKAKATIQYFTAPIYTNDDGYQMSASSDTQEYNIISRCQFVDSKIIEVPEYVQGLKVQQIGDYCFMGNKAVETIILPESVKQIGKYAFANCPNLKTVIAPGVEGCSRYAFYQCGNLVNVEMPNLTTANTALFKNCPNLETAKLGYLTQISNHAYFGCEDIKLVKTTSDDITFAEGTFYNCNELTIATPKDSTMETYAINNDIRLLGDIEAKGGSIRTTAAGLRFGYSYNEELNPYIEEYGFVYSYSALDDFDIDTNGIKKKVADRRENNGDNISYNLVFTNIPASAYNQTISARAYVKIGGEYFYSPILQRNFNGVAQAILADETIDQATKDAINELLSKEI